MATGKNIFFLNIILILINKLNIQSKNNLRETRDYVEISDAQIINVLRIGLPKIFMQNVL